MMSLSALAQTNIKLHSWQYGRKEDITRRACTVPSLVQENLIRDGLLPDPHYRTNERLIQGVELSDWVYETTFHISEARPLRSSEQYILSCEGIDTYSDIFVNNSKVGTTENMFVGYEFDLTPYIKRGSNSLRIVLKSPIETARPLQKQAGFNYPADNDHADIKYSPFTRKAPYHYGWDWGMRMLTLGIWQPITLKRYEQARLGDIRIEQAISWSEDGKTARSAQLSIKPEVIGADSRGTSLRIRLTHPAQNGKASTEEIKPEHTINAPLLWETYEHRPEGQEAARYSLSVDLLDRQGKILDSKTKKIGIRELNFIHRDNQFYFELNKRKIFAKGANYIPGDNILTKRTSEDFKQLFDDAEYARMNMIRVWGGGVYEDERFYEEADKRGILIWQDFMFACTAYPADTAFLSNVSRETEYQIKRLRHRPSIALWCGNNEVEEAIKYWGWDKRYKAEEYSRMREDYDPLFRKLLPEAVERHDPKRSYIHSSPTSANWGRPHTWLEGDSHYWGLWYGEEPFETFDSKTFAFVSEFGFQSFPDVPSLMSFATKEDMSLESEVMRQHQKASTGNRLIRKYMERYYPVPEDFEDFVYVSLVMQARGMEHAILAIRSKAPQTMGALIWQLNDSWPAVSWSSIDYYKNYKPLHFVMRRAFDPGLDLSGEKPFKSPLPSKEELQKLPRAAYSWSVRELGDGKAEIKIKALSELKDLWIASREHMGLRYSDNLLDLKKGETKLITVSGLPTDKPIGKESFYIRTMNDIVAPHPAG